MCGIIGYIGPNYPKEILLTGLKNLEYRGYDSAGVAFLDQDSVQIIKSVGKISNLEEKLKKENVLDCYVGIAHTRWATHGIPTEVNAHPHQVGRTTLVHNGIIENADVLKSELKKDGVIFQSNTDTEVVAALINKYLEKDNYVEAIEKAISRLKGSYALAILFQNVEMIFAVRKDSPLIIGVSDNGYFISSDILAISNYTDRYFLLEEGEICCLKKESYQVVHDGRKIDKEILEVNIDEETSGKGSYEHYMLKEIMEEPIVLRKLYQRLLEKEELPDLTEYEEIHIVACGSAMYAGMIGKSLLEEYANCKVLVEVASEYRYKNILYDRKTLVILISQSGETADTIAAMRKAHERNVDTLAIVNVKTSTIAREALRSIFIEAGSEVAVATTKAYILQVAVLSYLAYSCALKKGLIRQDEINNFKKVPDQIQMILEDRNKYREIAKEIYKAEDIFFIGRKIDYAICLEGSLKLKEVSYIHSEAYQAGELKHGTISLIEEGMPVFAILTEDDIFEKTLSNVEEVRSRGAKVILISSHQLENASITVPKTSPFVETLLVVPVLQLIAYEVAKLRGCDIDQPKNLAKSVTVE